MPEPRALPLARAGSPVYPDEEDVEAVSETTLLNASQPPPMSPPPKEGSLCDAIRQPRWWHGTAGYFRLPHRPHRLSIDSLASDEEEAPSLSIEMTRPPRRRARCVCLLLVFSGALFLLVLGVLSQLFRAPPYNLVAPQDYPSLLRNFAATQQLSPTQGRAWAATLGAHLEQLSDRLRDRDIARSCPAYRKNRLARLPISDDNRPPSAIPSTMFSSDHERPPAQEMDKWQTDWSGLGFDPQFLDEDMADQFVSAHFGASNASALGGGNSSKLSPTEHAWRALPRGVLRADFLRYILLLVRGGTWADMDVIPMAPVQEWAKPKERWVPRPDPGMKLAEHCPRLEGESAAPVPIRLVVGIECDPWDYLLNSPRGWLESLHILPMNRHREVQFTQWALHGAAGHPVLLDVLRRLLKADKLYSAYTIANSRGVSYEVAADGSRLAPAKDPHPWTDINAARRWSPPAPLYPPLSSEGGEGGDDTPRWLRWPLWPWMWPWPRLGWHELSVEEWTGPAVWTDAVVSYLYAVGGVRPRDLYGLAHPVQVADVLIAPSSWFNPYPHSLRHAKVLHNFRGSWKHGADTLPQKQR